MIDTSQTNRRHGDDMVTLDGLYPLPFTLSQNAYTTSNFVDRNVCLRGSVGDKQGNGFRQPVFTRLQLDYPQEDQVPGCRREGGMLRASSFLTTFICLQRLWECAERKTRKSSGIDGKTPASPICHCTLIPSPAVAVLAVLRSRTNAFPVSTVIIEQYRPPIDKFIIGL